MPPHLLQFAVAIIASPSRSVSVLAFLLRLQCGYDLPLLERVHDSWKCSLPITFQRCLLLISLAYRWLGEPSPPCKANLCGFPPPLLCLFLSIPKAAVSSPSPQPSFPSASLCPHASHTLSFVASCLFPYLLLFQRSEYKSWSS